jgi:hypothetical protein
VRQRRSPPGDVDESALDAFPDFPDLVLQLAAR